MNTYLYKDGYQCLILNLNNVCHIGFSDKDKVRITLVNNETMYFYGTVAEELQRIFIERQFEDIKKNPYKDVR